MGVPPVPDGPPTAEADGPLSDVLRPFVVVALLVAAMWVEEVVDLVPGTPFDSWGIRPRRLSGLPGIVWAPLLHDGFRHLAANTVPFLVLGSAVAAGGLGRFWRVTLVTTLTSGVGAWLLGGSRTVVLGASGVVFGYLTYLVARGIVARRPLWLAGGALALFVYGGILWGLLPRPGVSWSGHVFGAVGGVLAALALHRRPVVGDG